MDELPDDLRELAGRQYLRIHHLTADDDLRRIADEVQKIHPGCTEGVRPRRADMDAYLTVQMPKGQQRSGNRENIVEALLRVITDQAVERQ